MSIVCVSIPKSLQKEIDEFTREQGFSNRSEIVRQALRAYMSEGKRLQEIQGEITATITTIYRKGSGRGQTVDIQHRYSDLLLTFLHTHVEKSYCIEVIVAKGAAQVMKEFISALKSNKQVSEVKVTLL